MLNTNGLTTDQRVIVLEGNLLQQIEKTERHHKILVEGNGVLPLVERVRNLESFQNSVKFWLRTVAVAIVLQTITFAAAAIVYFVKLYPVLQDLSKQP